MPKLAYICNDDQIEKCHKEQTTNGEYFFIRKKGERVFFAYRRVDRGGKESFYAQVGLPAFLFKELIQSGKVGKVMSS